MARQRGDARRGNFIVMIAMVLVALLAFGALAVDVSYVRYAQGQAQDVADAASQAAVMVLRKTGDQDQARDAAGHIVAANWIAGGQGTLDDIDFGVWDDSTEPGSFSSSNINPNAVHVQVGRHDANSVTMMLGRIFGWDTTDVYGQATSATRSLQVILVMDITGSWSQRNFHNARAASLAFWQVIKDSHSDWDQIGMTVFTNRFGWEYTPLTFVKNDTGQISTQWAKLNVASKAGQDADPYDNTECSQNASPDQNNFSSPVVGGCYPDMPREYRDEPGTDHTTGMEMAATMFSESHLPTAYKAMVVLTDGYPNGVGSAGTARGADGYSEARWREYLGPAPHSTAEIKVDSIDLTAKMWSEQRVHTWVVSFVADDWFMHDMVRGDGYFQLTSSSSALIDIFEDIALSMPVAIVE